jgi:hypothetical protein
MAATRIPTGHGKDAATPAHKHVLAKAGMATADVAKVHNKPASGKKRP